MRPDTSEAIGLEFHGHGKWVGLGRIAVLKLPDLVFDANDLLDMVPDFVRQHVGLRKLARSAEALLEFIVKAQVNVNFFVRRAIKGARGGLRAPASGVGLISKQHELRMAIRSPGLLGQAFVPGLLRVVQDESDELHQRLFLFVERGIGTADGARGLRRTTAAQKRKEVLLKNQAQNKQ